jgi:predicted metal-dependent hydrolase
MACPNDPTPQLLHAFEQFNRGEYWAQHETLETIWRAERDEMIRNFYKGVLQIGVGFYHLTRQNYSGAIKVLTRGINYLRPYSPRCFGVDVARLIDESARILARVHAREEIARNELPRVYFEI